MFEFGLLFGKAARRFRRRSALLPVLLACCGILTPQASAASANTATVTLTPAGATLAPGTSLAYYAAVSGTASQTLSWYVDGIPGGSASVGLLTVNGTAAHMLYTAPATAGTHTLTTVATNSAGATSSGSTTVTIQAVNLATVTLSPANATVASGGTVAYYAAVTGSASQTLAWYVDGVLNGSPTVGTLTLNGNAAHMLYTAPASGGAHTVSTVATNAAGATSMGTTTLTVQSASKVAVTLAYLGTPTLILSGATLLTPTVTGASNLAVTWAVDGIAGGNAIVGTVVAPLAGGPAIYNAPALPGTHKVTATSVADPTKSASASFTIATTTVPVGTIPVGANVRNAPYNALGNGVHDDTAALQAAINAVAGTGKAVVVPAGTYMINPIVYNNAGLRLGSNMTLILQTGAVLQALPTSTQVYEMVLASNVQNVNIVGGTLIGNSLNNTIGVPTKLEDGNTLAINGSSNVVVEGVTTQNAFCDGIYVGLTSTNVTICGCTALNNRRNGMSVVDARGVLVVHSTFGPNLGAVEVAGQPPANGTGLDVETNSYEHISTVLVSHCTFTGNYSIGLAWGKGGSAVGASTDTVFVDKNLATGNHRGFDVENCTVTAVTNNTATTNTGFGIYVHNGAVGVACLGNTITATGPLGDGAGLELYLDSGTLVQGNTISGSAKYGAFVAYSTNPTLLDNNLTGNPIGMYLEDSTGVTQAGNTQ